MVERPDRGRRIDQHAALAVGHDGVVGPGVPQLAGHVDELLGPPVAVVALEEPAATEVLAGERVRRRDRVPRGATVAQVVERGELTGQLVGLVERRVQRGRQPDPVGHGGQRGEHGERVRSADDVEIEDAAPVLAQAQPLGEEEEVELAALGGLGEVHERGEVGLAARGRIAPHRRVVDAREVGGEVDLLAGGVHVGTAASAYRFGGRSSPNRSRSVAPAWPIGRPACREPRDDVVDEPVERRRQRVGSDEEAVDGALEEPRVEHLGDAAGLADKVETAETAHDRAPEAVELAALPWLTDPDVRQHRDAVRVASGRRDQSPDVVPARPRRGQIGGVDEHDVGAARPRPRSRSGSWASIATSGWPCGDRGVIEGPRTLKNSPSKSM